MDPLNELLLGWSDASRSPVGSRVAVSCLTAPAQRGPGGGTAAPARPL